MDFAPGLPAPVSAPSPLLCAALGGLVFVLIVMWLSVKPIVATLSAAAVVLLVFMFASPAPSAPSPPTPD